MLAVVTGPCKTCPLNFVNGTEVLRLNGPAYDNEVLPIKAQSSVLPPVFGGHWMSGGRMSGSIEFMTADM